MHSLKDRYKEAQVTICVQLPPSLYYDTKNYAKEKKVTMREMVIESLRDYIKTHELQEKLQLELPNA